MESGLPGLKPILEALGISVTAVAEKANTNARFLYRVAAGQQDCTTMKVRALAAVLCCSTDDLLYRPSLERLRQIKAAYLQAEADRAREEARAS